VEQFTALLELARRLNSPDGCPWDLKQTFATLQPYVLEEAHEVVDAVDRGDDQQIVEELGDLLYTVLFYAVLGEKQGRFSMEQILETIHEKMIRRHPHIFGEKNGATSDEVEKQWEKIKKEEKKEAAPKSALEQLPKTLPELVKAQKIVRKLHRAGHPQFIEKNGSKTEEELASAFLDLVWKAESSGLDCEGMLRRTTIAYDKELTKHFETSIKG